MSKYEKFSKEELIALAEKQDSELASKKYGLVWDAEREPEQVVLDCGHNLPILKRVKGKEIKTDKNEDNILIEGDNYHALTVLNYTHQEKIDVIYIDPPYNTGKAKEWKYNDKYVDENDGYKHSKWLNLMEKRLNLSRNLLKDAGVIFVSVDHHEVSQLKLTLDRIFNENNFVGTLIWRKKEGGGQADAHFVTEHEYVLVYGKSENFKWIDEEIPIEEAEFNKEDEDGKFTAVKLAKWGNTARREDRPKMYFPIKSPDQKNFFPIAPDGADGRWRVGKKRMEMLVEKNLIYWQKKAGNWLPYEKVYFTEGEVKKIKERSILFDLATTADGTNELTEIFGKKDVFGNPKPTDLIKFFLQYGAKEDAVVLDFFAGSGTTGHAVLSLNKEDSGNRKFILCTNNEVNGIEKELKEKGLSEKEVQEHGICRKITYPRLEKVIKGYKKNGNGEKVSGLGGNLQYFRTALVKDTKNKDQMRVDLTDKCTEMLCVRENIFNLEKETEDYKIFFSNKGEKFLCVYYNLYDGSFQDFLKEIKKLKGEKKIYMFSMDGKTNKSLFVDVKNFEIEEIPQKIIEVYKQLVKMNIPVKADVIFVEFDKANKKVFEDKDKDEGARSLRIVLEKTIQKIAQKSGVSIFKENSKEEKIAVLNDTLKSNKVFTQVQWEENKTYLTIGNQASHGEYSEYDLKQVENFYRHIQTLLNIFNI